MGAALPERALRPVEREALGSARPETVDFRALTAHGRLAKDSVVWYDFQLMRKVPLGQSLQIIRQGSLNWRADRPIVVSFEVTDACTCFCKHCDHGGLRDMSRDMKPADYRRYMEELKPVVVQVSGGEPLMREDLSDVIRAIRQPNGLPFTILVSNWSHMTLERYVDLCKAGVDQFSVSLDFPDERHDDFRGHAGLYEHLSQIVPAAAKLGYDNICLNNCITSENVEYINARGGQGEGVGRQHQLQRLFRAPHRLPRLLPDDARAAGDAARRTRAPEDPHRQPLGDQLGDDD